MIYALKDSGRALPEGIVGNYVDQHRYHFSGDAVNDGAISHHDAPQDVSRKKVLSGSVLAMTEEESAIMDAYEYQQRVATITQDMWQTAAAFRVVLRRYFGSNAETNREITASAVAAFFVQRVAAGTTQDGDGEAAVFLQQAFQAIAAWTGDGTSWSFPWAMIPEVP